MKTFYQKSLTFKILLRVNSHNSGVHGIRKTSIWELFYLMWKNTFCFGDNYMFNADTLHVIYGHSSHKFKLRLLSNNRNTTMIEFENMFQFSFFHFFSFLFLFSFFANPSLIYLSAVDNISLTYSCIKINIISRKHFLN